MTTGTIETIIFQNSTSVLGTFAVPNKFDCKSSRFHLSFNGSVSDGWCHTAFFFWYPQLKFEFFRRAYKTSKSLQ